MLLYIFEIAIPASPVSTNAMQVLPSKELQPYIRHYLFLKSEGDHVKKLRLFSDGSMAMVLCLKGTLIDTGTKKSLPGSFVYGQINAFRDLCLMHEASFIIVVFQPDGACKLLGVPAHELTDKVIVLQDIFNSHDLRLCTRAMNLIKPEDQLNTLNTFFKKLIAGNLLSNQMLVHASLAFITKSKGLATIKELVEHTGYSERHLERAFKEGVGISPKKFAGIVKLHSFLRMLKSKTDHSNITAMCYDAGYFDQSHLIKEFRKYTGITPTEYVQDTDRLAINFMQLNVSD